MPLLMCVCVVADLCSDTPRDLRGGVRLRTFDFKKMYTNIELDSLKTRMRALLGQLFAFERKRSRAHRFLKVLRERKKSEWLPRNTNDEDKFKVFHAEKLSRWFNYLVDNIFLQFTSDNVLRQRIGIPMGTNCAVFVANLFCFSYEYEFISQLVRMKKYSLLRKFAYTKRFVDDLLALNNESFDDYLYCTRAKGGVRGIYPDFLELVPEQYSTQKASFLDTEIVFNGIRWFTMIYDKREHPPPCRTSNNGNIRIPLLFVAKGDVRSDHVASPLLCTHLHTEI